MLRTSICSASSSPPINVHPGDAFLYLYKNAQIQGRSLRHHAAVAVCLDQHQHAQHEQGETSDGVKVHGEGHGKAELDDDGGGERIVIGDEPHEPLRRR